jgi:hypothetical protein
MLPMSGWVRFEEKNPNPEPNLGAGSINFSEHIGPVQKGFGSVLDWTGSDTNLNQFAGQIQKYMNLNVSLI